MSGRGKPSLIRLVAINLAVFVALVAAAELAWRLMVGPTELERRMEEFLATSRAQLAPCARQERRGAETFLVADAAPERLAFAYSFEKPADSTRIAVVGESSGSMLGFMMSALARDEEGLARVEILNCAEPGSAREHVERRAREVLDYAPDVLVVVFGHNVDFQYPTDLGVLHVLSWRARSRLVSGLAARRRQATPPVAQPLAQRMEGLEAWLRELAAEARRRDVVLMLTTLPSNLWAPPRDSSGARFDPRYFGALFRYWSGDRDHAIAKLTRLAEDEGHAVWHFTAGQWLARENALAQARAHLRRAIDAERAEPGAFVPLGRDRATTAVNALLRRVAEEEGLVLRDTDRAMQEMAFEGILGWGLMEDHCHLHRDVVRDEAIEVLDAAHDAAGVSFERPGTSAASAGGLAEPGPVLELLAGGARASGWGIEAIASAVERWARQDPAVARAAVERYLASPKFAELDDSLYRASLLAAVAEGYWHAGERDEARRLSGEACRYDHAPAWVQRGLFALADGDRGAAGAAFEKALALEPSRKDAAFFATTLAERSGARGPE